MCLEKSPDRLHAFDVLTSRTARTRDVSSRFFEKSVGRTDVFGRLEQWLPIDPHARPKLFEFRGTLGFFRSEFPLQRLIAVALVNIGKTGLGLSAETACRREPDETSSNQRCGSYYGNGRLHDHE